MQQLSRQERLDWLQLIRTRNVGPATFSDLIGHFGNAADALAALPDFARRGGGKGGFKLDNWLRSLQSVARPMHQAGQVRAPHLCGLQA